MRKKNRFLDLTSTMKCSSEKYITTCETKKERKNLERKLLAVTSFPQSLQTESL